MAALPSISRDNAEGPRWDDVHEYLAYLQHEWGHKLRLQVSTESNFSNRTGFRVELWADGIPVLLASVGIGRNYAAGARTMAGAAYQACLIGHETLELATFIKVTRRPSRRRQRKP